MTSSTVNLRGIACTGGFQMPAPKVQETGGGTEFSQVLENATSRDNVQEQSVDSTKDNCKVEQEAPVEEVQETEQTDVRDVKEDTKGVTESQKPENVEVSEDDLEAAMEVIQSAILEIQELFCETLGVSKEELTQALDALGMTEMDLLATGNVSKLTLHLQGENELALLTNEELYNTVQSLEEAVQQISEDVVQNLNEVSPEDAQQLFGEAVKALEMTNTSNEAPVIEITDETPQQEVVSTLEKPEERKTNTGNGKSEEHQNSSNLLAGNQVVTGNFQQNIANVQSTEVVFEMEQPQMIMDQIMEHMDIQLNAEESTLQMQLHPEKLGTLQVTISAKEGVMTAQFTTESEAVKAVLENQIIQLQDKFDQQNIKVEAIEITVATHGFEQNLQQDDQKDNYQEEEKKSRVRKIDLGSLETMEELPEEDQVVADMMQLHGNRVDYMA
ncbi:MAG: flagellar hook-length control protein FliK [Lachnospiraceae bacterium]|nr:flagellar hook-length control protein FliK [Lachnospiraceae bacterium]